SQTASADNPYRCRCSRECFLLPMRRLHMPTKPQRNPGPCSIVRLQAQMRGFLTRGFTTGTRGGGACSILARLVTPRATEASVSGIVGDPLAVARHLCVAAPRAAGYTHGGSRT